MEPSSERTRSLDQSRHHRSGELVRGEALARHPRLPRPNGCCVEVPCLTDRTGGHPGHVGVLPPPLTHLNLSNIAVQERAVWAVLERDRRLALQACLLDPLTRSVLSLEETQALFEEIWAAEESLLTYFDGR